ncbi:hypothetical protein GGF50DRAFT_121622 [Schizophyllum commune]
MTAVQSMSPTPASHFVRFNPFKTSSAKPFAPPSPEPAYILVQWPRRASRHALRARAARQPSQGQLGRPQDRCVAREHALGGRVGVPDADTEWQLRYDGEVINIASEALAQTRANQAHNYPLSSLCASNAAYQTT